MLVIQKVRRLDVPMHDAAVGQMLNSLQHAPHIVLDLDERHLSKVRLERLRLLIPEHQADLSLEPIGLYHLRHV